MLSFYTQIAIGKKKAFRNSMWNRCEKTHEGTKQRRCVRVIFSASNFRKDSEMFPLAIVVSFNPLALSGLLCDEQYRSKDMFDLHFSSINRT